MLYVFFKVKICITITLTEKYEDTREIIRSRKSNENRQHNVQKKKDKR